MFPRPLDPDDPDGWVRDDRDAPAQPTPSTIRSWRMRELAQVSADLTTHLDPSQRRILLQHWSDLTLLLAA